MHGKMILYNLQKARPGAALAYAWHMHGKSVLIIFKKMKFIFLCKNMPGLVHPWCRPGTCMAKSVLIIYKENEVYISK